MRIISWMLVGLIVGFVSSKIANRSGEGLVGLFRDLLLGVFGAVAGGYLVEIFGYSDATEMKIWSMLGAVIGSIVVLLADHVVRIAVAKRRNLFPPEGNGTSWRE